MRKIVIWLILLLFVLSGCLAPPTIAQPISDFGMDLLVPGASLESNLEPEEEKPTIPVVGGELNIAVPLPRTLNPLLNSDPGVDEFLRLIFEPLVIFDEFMKPAANPAIVQSIVFAPDGRSLTITLRDNVFWEDNSPITAADIAFSIDFLRFTAPQSALYKNNALAIASHSIQNNRNIQLNFNSPMWHMKYMLNFPVIPADYYRTSTMSDIRSARNMHPLGNGPFRFHSYELANSLTLIPNQNAPAGRPFISKITALVMRDELGETYAFEQGIVDVSVGSPSDFGRHSANGKNRASQFNVNDFDFIGFNFRRTIFADIAIREAIAHSFDYNEAINRYFDYDLVAQAPINPASWLFEDDLLKYSYEPEKAAEIFASLGFTKGADGFFERVISEILPPLRLSMTIIVNQDNAQGMGISKILQSGLIEVGVDTTLEILPFDDFRTRLSLGDFDIMVGTLSFFSTPSSDFLHSGSSNNMLRYNSSELDNIINSMFSASNEAIFEQAAINMQHYIADNLPILGVAFRRKMLFTSGFVHGNIIARQGHIFINANQWFIQ